MSVTVDPAIPATQTTWRSPSWGAIIAGSCFAIAGMFVLAELCSALGWSMVRALTHPGYASAVRSAVACAAISGIIAAMIALFFGGWVGGHLARRTRASESMLHGALVWALSTILIVFAGIASMGMVAGGALSVVNATIRGSGEVVGGVARGAIASQPAYRWDEIRERAEDLFGMRGTAANGNGMNENASQNDNQQANQTGNQQAIQTGSAGNQPTVGNGVHAAYGLIGRLFGSPEANPSADDQGRLEAALVANAHMTQEQAHAQVQTWIQEANAAKEQAREAAVTAGHYAAVASFIAFIGTVLSLVCAGLGGLVGGTTAGFHQDRASRAQARTVHVVVEGQAGAHPV